MIRSIFSEAVRDDCESDLDLYLPISTFDQAVAAFRTMPKKSPEGRLRPLIEAQCGPLSIVLNQDVMGIVYEYLFIQQRNERGEETEDRNQQNKRWFEAVRSGDKELVTQMLSENPSLLEVRGVYGDVSGNTALHLAAIEGHSSIVELLLAASPTLGLLGTFLAKLRSCARPCVVKTNTSVTHTNAPTTRVSE